MKGELTEHAALMFSVIFAAAALATAATDWQLDERHGCHDFTEAQLIAGKDVPPACVRKTPDAGALNFLVRGHY